MHIPYKESGNIDTANCAVIIDKIRASSRNNYSRTDNGKKRAQVMRGICISPGERNNKRPEDKPGTHLFPLPPQPPSLSTPPPPPLPALPARRPHTTPAAGSNARDAAMIIVPAAKKKLRWP